MSDDLDAEAEALLQKMTRARRRAKPRVAEALYDAEDARVETRYGPVQAWRLGEGPAVLLVHGWEDDNALWGPLIDAFVEIGRAVVAFDLPGHGYSEAEEASIGSAKAAVLAVTEALGPIDAVVAHSFGCVASTAALDAGLAAQRAVLIASPLPTEDMARRRAEASAEVYARARALYAERMGEPLHAFAYEAAAARMRAEALIIHSMDDEQCPVANAQTLASLWPGAETLIADDLGHRLIAQDEDIIRAIVMFAA